MSEMTLPFSIGDKVRSKANARLHGKVAGISIGLLNLPTYRVHNERGDYVGDFLGYQIEVQPDKLAPEAAWIEVGRIIERNVSADTFYSNTEGERSSIRHECYKVLGGAGVMKVLAHDVVRNELNAAIDRANTSN